MFGGHRRGRGLSCCIRVHLRLPYRGSLLKGVAQTTTSYHTPAPVDPPLNTTRNFLGVRSLSFAPKRLFGYPSNISKRPRPLSDEASI